VIYTGGASAYRVMNDRQAVGGMDVNPSTVYKIDWQVTASGVNAARLVCAPYIAYTDIVGGYEVSVDVTGGVESSLSGPAVLTTGENQHRLWLECVSLWGVSIVESWNMTATEVASATDARPQP
jgi:hypothetical protein